MELPEELMGYWLTMCVSIVSVTGCFSSRSSQTAVFSRVGGAVSADAIATHMSTLAHDSLRGRAPTSPEYGKAATYVARQFAKSRLKPAISGSWFQEVPIRGRKANSPRTSIVLGSPNSVDQSFGEDSGFVVMQPGPASARLDGRVIFVGYGVTTGTHDDYRGVDVQGKIVAFLPGSPTSQSIDERVYLETTKVRNAAKHGAIAALKLWVASDGGVDAWRDLQNSYADAGLFHLALEPSAEDGPRYASFESIWVGPAASQFLLDAAAGTRKSERAPISSVELPIWAKIIVEGQTTLTRSPNVVGLLLGSDPALRHEFVVITAHLDHLGIGKPVNGDSIYNGAVDNASGIAGLLEVARIVSAGQHPRRSLLLVAVTGEEAGDLGSDFFLRHSPVPLDCIVANVNIDGLSLWPFDGIVPRGSEHSDLSSIIATTAMRSGVTISADPTPERYTIAGSDQYSFMVRGIPSVIFATARSGTARQLALDWVRNRYHKPSDDMSQPLDFSAAARFTDALISVITGIADASERPKWNEGDFFGTLRNAPGADIEAAGC